MLRIMVISEVWVGLGWGEMGIDNGQCVWEKCDYDELSFNVYAWLSLGVGSGGLVVCM